MQISEHPLGEHPKADGKRWLSTAQAVKLAASRGKSVDRKTLARWGEKGELDKMGMAYWPHGGKTNKLATFEDLLFDS